MFTMRFDMRAPASGAPARELYSEAPEMALWAQSRGCMSVVLCEHHMSEDGYLPSPMVLAGAMAAKTSTVLISVAALPLPLYDPIRLAEEMAVLDIISGGRMFFVAAIGYRPAEYEMYGVDFHRRGRLADEKLPVLLRAKTGEPFEHEGRRIRVTPTPLTPGGPAVVWGGGSVAAARRTGRHGIGFLAQSGGDELRVAYLDAARAAGHEPGICVLNPADQPTTVFVAEDVDQAWEELGPYLMHDVRAYASWNEGEHATASLSFVQTAAELRAERRSHQILTVDEAVDLVRAGGMLPLHPLVGGLPPEIGWRYLQTVVDQVLPAAQQPATAPALETETA
jgi:alkanesulfonate monooxygenase SsuD/methylene tetrahydromethanopterin reductase-like flavin-dependent oxidoreductase (luciferase family)